MKKHNKKLKLYESNSNLPIENKMKEWNIKEQIEYLCPDGVMTIEEFRNLGHKIIDEEYDRLGW